MMHYRDRSFCTKSHQCANDTCPRKLSPRDGEAAEAMGLPIAWADYRTETCGFVEAISSKEGGRG